MGRLIGETVFVVLNYVFDLLVIVYRIYLTLVYRERFPVKREKEKGKQKEK